MSTKRFNSLGVMIVLLAIALIGGGCATTSSSQAAKPHKPQMITADGVEEVGSSTVEHAFANGISLPDPWANTLAVMGPVFQILGQLLACH